MTLRALAAVLVVGMVAGRAPAQDAEPPADIRNSVVKIFSTYREPDLRRPWTKRQPADASGTGVVIDGKRILTNAHVVQYASQLFVQPDESSDKLPASVVAVGHGIDLAVITLEDESFFDTHAPAAFAEALPNVADKVNAYGYPVGGDSLSITEGIVSRIEYAGYNDETMGLRIQVDAALNPGNSGGPALSGGKVVGLVFSGINDADNIGYLIPVEEIRAFLDDIADGAYEGRAQVRDSMQTLENPALRTRLGMSKDAAGMMITRPASDAPDYPLKAWDIVSKIGATPVDNRGMVQVGPNLRLDFRYLVPKTAAGGRLPLSIIRAGQAVEVELPVSARSERLLRPLGISYPSFFIYGPLVFSPVYSDHVDRLSAPFLAVRKSPIIRRAFDRAAFEGEQLVAVASPLFPHRITKGYAVDYFPVVDTVNGVKIKNLRHLVETLRDLNDEYVVFEWVDDGVEKLVFKREEIVKATDEILDDNGIRSQASEDLRDAWSGR